MQRPRNFSKAEIGNRRAACLAGFYFYGVSGFYLRNLNGASLTASVTWVSIPSRDGVPVRNIVAKKKGDR